ncbi:unnamed protein product [Amaranthus hypochondriacus]
MEEKGCVFVSETRDDSLCAMYFGISCAFFALKNLSNQVWDNQKCLETRDKMLQGGAHLLGLLAWRSIQREESMRIEKNELIHKLEMGNREIMELKRVRSEDAKANEKVASIYAAQEQGWFVERRKLRHQVASLLNDLRILDKRKNEEISELNRKLGEMEVLFKSKEKVLEEETRKRKEYEEKVKSVEGVLEELRETNKRESKNHSCQMLKHKTAFIELVSNQRQVEAELGRTLRQVEAAKQQLEFLYEEKEEVVLMVEELSIEIEKIRAESEHKDKILSAMMRKLKLDSPEKQMILKDQVKRLKPKRKMSSISERQTLRNLFPRQASENANAEECDDVNGDDFDAEVRKENADYTSRSEHGFPAECAEFQEETRLDKWVRAEAEKYRNAVEQRHQLELDALEEQIRMKDDKLEASRWHQLSAEVESKRLQSKIEGLNQEMTQLRDSNLRLETLLIDREVELKTLKDQTIAMQLSNLSSQKVKKQSSKKEIMLDDDKGRSKVKIVRKNPCDKEQEAKKCMLEEIKKDEGHDLSSKHNSSTSFSSIEDVGEKEGEQSFEITRKEVASSWKIDLHALGVTYKIKRLNQQLLMLDRLTGQQENSEIKSFSLLISFLKKQVSRYHSLQEKTDDLSKRMGDKDATSKRGVFGSKKTKEETRKLEHFLEETFQLQRFIVAAGQKLMELQSKIASGFVAEITNELDGPDSFDMKRFGDTIQSLLKDVQRGLEVRISRFIGDLEGTLAYEGIHFLK